jgi:hypothetical protein
MASFVKFYSFVEALAEKKHDLGADTLKVALTNVAPALTNSQLSNITEISYTNCSDRTLITTSSSQSGGIYNLVLTDLTLTASAGSVGPFRYIVIFNETSTNDLLIGYSDYGQSITLADGEYILIDFNASGLFSIQ